MQYLSSRYDGIEYDEYTSVPARFTPERFAKWLRENPDRKLRCGNPNSCALAQLVADELMPEDAKYVEVAGPEIEFRQSKNGAIVAGWIIPDWAEKFINVFDEGDYDYDLEQEVDLPKIHGKSRQFRTGLETIDVLNHVTGRKFRRPKAA